MNKTSVLLLTKEKCGERQTLKKTPEKGIKFKYTK